MDSGVLIFHLVVASGLIGWWAHAWGRNFWAWWLVAALSSAFIAAVLLLLFDYLKPCRDKVHGIVKDEHAFTERFRDKQDEV